jgi:hypothetical protein
MEETMVAELTRAATDTIKSAARKLTGFLRRRFQAEVANKYCWGSARQAEREFGWRRDTVETGLNELRTGIRCLDAFGLRGRHRTEADCPELVREIHALVEPRSQADPKFQTPLAFTRMTAKAVRRELRAGARGTGRAIPAERTVHDILNRLGYRLRRVRKTRPKKRSAIPTRFSPICGRFTPGPRKIRVRCVSPWIPRPR